MRVDRLRTYRKDQECVVMVRSRVRHEKVRQGHKRAKLGKEKCLGPPAILKAEERAILMEEYLCLSALMLYFSCGHHYHTGSIFACYS